MERQTLVKINIKALKKMELSEELRNVMKEETCHIVLRNCVLKEEDVDLKLKHRCSSVSHLPPPIMNGFLCLMLSMLIRSSLVSENNQQNSHRKNHSS